MKNPIKLAILCTAVCAAMLAFTHNASAVVINPDDQLVGTVTPGVPSGQQNETDYVNHLITLTPGTSDVFDGQTFNRSLNDFGSLPTAVFSSKVEDPTDLTLTLDGTYTYILAKYDQNQAGSIVWYVEGLVGDFTIPESFNGHDISHYTLFGGGSVPDGGATVMLLGAALGSLGMARRFLRS